MLLLLFCHHDVGLNTLLQQGISESVVDGD